MALLTLAKAKEALIKHNGVMLYAAEACGCSRQTLWRFIRDNPELQEIKENATEELVDLAEKQMQKAIEAGDMKTVRWYLERLGKDRGYVTRQETTGKDGEPLQIGEITRTVVAPTKK